MCTLARNSDYLIFGGHAQWGHYFHQQLKCYLCKLMESTNVIYRIQINFLSEQTQAFSLSFKINAKIAWHCIALSNICMFLSQDSCATVGASLVAIESQTEETFIQNRLHHEFGQTMFLVLWRGHILQRACWQRPI